MAYFYAKKILKDVRTLLDRNPEPRLLLEGGDIETLSLDDMIDRLFPDAVRVVEDESPLYMLEPGLSLNGSFALEEADEAGYMSGWVALPDKFMRLICFKMNEWDYQVNEAITEDDPRYPVQKSKFGVKGSPEAPVVAIVQNPSGLRLEFFTVKGSDCWIEKGQYVSRKEWLWDGGDVTDYGKKKIDVSEKVYEACVRRCADMVCVSMSDSKAGVLRGEEKPFIGLPADSAES